MELVLKSCWDHVHNWKLSAHTVRRQTDAILERHCEDLYGNERREQASRRRNESTQRISGNSPVIRDMGYDMGSYRSQ